MGAALQGLMRFSFWRRLQNQTRITSFSMCSCSAISRISSEVGFWFYRQRGLLSWVLPPDTLPGRQGAKLTARKLFSKAKRTFVSMLVLFLRLRPGSPSKPRLGLLSWLGLGRLESTDIVSAKRGDRDVSDHFPPCPNTSPLCVPLAPLARLTCVIEPLLQEGLEFAHILEAQVKGLEAGNGRLAEVVAIELAHGQAHIALVQRGGGGVWKSRRGLPVQG